MSVCRLRLGWAKGSDALGGLCWFVRRQGLGKRLLARSFLEMHARGYKHSIISTDLTNHRGQIFYTNFGYTPCARTASHLQIGAASEPTA